MKREPSTAARTLRAVALVITLFSVLTFATLAYSAYEDVSPLVSPSGGTPPAISVKESAPDSHTAVLSVNVTMKNAGLYPVGIAISCSAAPGVTCTNVSATIEPGQTQKVGFTLTASGVDLAKGQKFPSVSSLVELSLVPFAKLDVSFNPANFAAGGGSG